jgi:hypothetical protein
VYGGLGNDEIVLAGTAPEVSPRITV